MGGKACETNCGINMYSVFVFSDFISNKMIAFSSCSIFWKCVFVFYELSVPRSTFHVPRIHDNSWRAQEEQNDFVQYKKSILHFLHGIKAMNCIGWIVP